MFVAYRVVAHDLTTLRFVFLNLVEPDNSWAEAALDPEAMDDLFDDPAGSTNLDVLMTHGTVLIKD